MYVIYHKRTKKAVVRKNKSIYFKTLAAATTALSIMSKSMGYRARDPIKKSDYSVTTAKEYNEVVNPKPSLKISPEDIARLETMKELMDQYITLMGELDSRIPERAYDLEGVSIEACADSCLALTQIRKLG